MATTTMSSPLGHAPEDDNIDGEPHKCANLRLRHQHQQIASPARRKPTCINNAMALRHTAVNILSNMLEPGPTEPAAEDATKTMTEGDAERLRQDAIDEDKHTGTTEQDTTTP